MRKGTLRSGSCRNVLEMRSTAPDFQFGLTTWNISMASGELALEPKPLSVSVRKLPSLRSLMPERPCTGWPLKGRLMPVGRGAALSDRAEMPGTLSGVSTRWPGGAAGDLQLGRRVGRGGNDRHGRQDGMALEHGWVLGLRHRDR